MAAPTHHDYKALAPTDNPVRVLLIDDEADTLLPILAQYLEPKGFRFHKESNEHQALQSVASIDPDGILLDLHFPGDDRRGEPTTGGKLLTDIRRRFVSTPVIVFSTRLDDFDIPEETFDEKPHWRFAKPKFDRGDNWAAALAQAMRETIDMARSDSNPDANDMGFLVGQTQEMREVVRQIRAASRNTLSVLIYGETGSGKLAVAKAIQVCHKSMSDILRPETLRKLQDYDWPGNIRELENTIKGAVANATSNILFPRGTSYLPDYVHQAS